MQLIKQSESTAARRRIPIALVDDTDGKTAETGITLSAGDLKISKAGGAQANHAGTLTELAIGDYYYEPTSGECDTPGYLTGTLVKSGVRTFRFAVQIVAFDPYDTVRLGLTALPNAAANGTGGLHAPILNSSTAQSGSSTGVTLNAGVAATNDILIGWWLYIAGGTGAGQARQIIDWDNTTKVATVYAAGPPAQGQAWITTPDNTSTVMLLPGFLVPATISDGALTSAKFGSLTAPTAVPTATPAMFDALAWLFTLSRNKITETATTQTLRNDADSGNIATAAVSDDATTFIRAEWT